jgi:hypothetical protein
MQAFHLEIKNRCGLKDYGGVLMCVCLLAGWMSAIFQDKPWINLERRAYSNHCGLKDYEVVLMCVGVCVCVCLLAGWMSAIF